MFLVELVVTAVAIAPIGYSLNKIEANIEKHNKAKRSLEILKFYTKIRTNKRKPKTQDTERQVITIK